MKTQVTGPSPTLWTVHLPALNTYYAFESQAQAQADINQHNYGTLLAPTGYSGTSTYESGAPSQVAVAVRPANPPGGGSSQRGNIRVQATQIPGGCRLTIDSCHQAVGDVIAMTIQAMVGSTPMAIFSLPPAGVSNPSGYRGQVIYDLNYALMTQQIRAANIPVDIVPGMRLAVFANWPSGHTWGGLNSDRPGGAFVAP
jgi:hypothetical protein